MENVILPVLNIRIEEIKKFSPNWFLFSQNGSLTDSEVEEIIKFDGYNHEKKMEYFSQNDQTICEILVKLLNRVAVERILHFILVLLDSLIQYNFTSTRHFISLMKRVGFDHFNIFLQFLNKDDEITAQLSSKILTKLIAFGYSDFPESTAVVYCDWLKKNLDNLTNEFIYEDLNSCQYILRVSSFRKIFQSSGLLKTLVKLMIRAQNYQIQYQTGFCIWLVAFESTLTESLIKMKIITIFSQILETAQKTKLIRIILAACVNLVSNSPNSKKVLALFVYNKFITILQSFQNRVFNDVDLDNDVKFMLDHLLITVQDLSTFDEYSGELLNGKLEWTPVHKSDKFWRENAQRLCENNYELLQVLANTIKNSEDPIALAVACHDIGEFVRYYSRGKLAVQENGVIEKIMQLLFHENQSVKYEALISLQKIMVHNWDFLGKQLSDQQKV